MLNTRLYHPAWKKIFIHGIFSTIGTAGIVVSMSVALMSLNWTAVAILGGIIAVATGTTAYSAMRLDFCVRRRLNEHSTHTPTSALLGSFPYLLWVQVLYFLALVLALRQKTVDWRGIQYDIAPADGDCQIRMREYRPIELALDPVSSIV